MEMNNKNNKDSDMTADEDQVKLPEVLQKLEIVPQMPTVRVSDEKLPILLNPFYFQLKKSSKDNELLENDTTVKLFGSIKCKCKESIEHNIVNQTRFKHKRNSSLKRTILKESLLKTVQKDCTHSNCNEVNNCSTKRFLEFSDYPTLEALRLEEDDSLKTVDKHSKQLNIDLRIFIKNCGVVSTNNIKSSSSIGRKNFTTLQSSDDRVTKYKRRSKKNSSDVSKINLATSITQNSNNVSCSSSSCSQQARSNSSASTCDITIDELACYFETFVHIPKKMSTMAEMMYI